MTDLEVDVRDTTEVDEPNVAHIGRRSDVTAGYVEGAPVVALCGRRFVPSRNPDGLPLCDGCRTQLARLRAGRGGVN